MWAAALLLAAANPPAFQYCVSCHSRVAGEIGLPGPNLAGVIGRRAGTLPDFAYSDAMRAAGAGGLVWTRNALKAFLANPGAVVPGTEMQRLPPGLPVEAVIAELEGSQDQPRTSSRE